jgi:hypothetical protein
MAVLVGNVTGEPLRTATHECGERGHSHYRAWHAWALANLTAAVFHADAAREERHLARQESDLWTARASKADSRARTSHAENALSLA